MSAHCLCPWEFCGNDIRNSYCYGISNNSDCDKFNKYIVYKSIYLIKYTAMSTKSSNQRYAYHASSFICKGCKKIHTNNLDHYSKYFLDIIKIPTFFSYFDEIKCTYCDKILSVSRYFKK